MNCPKCDTKTYKNGTTAYGKQKHICPSCRHSFETDKESVSPPPKPEATTGISEAQLRAKHDMRFIVESKCSELKKGIFMTQAEFVQMCRINPGAGYRGVMDHPEYDKYHGRAGSIIYWSHPDSIKKLKDEGVLL